MSDTEERVRRALAEIRIDRDDMIGSSNGSSKKFKKGDRVKICKSSQYYGSQSKVDGIIDDIHGGSIDVKFDDGYKNVYTKRDLEFVDKQKVKPKGKVIAFKAGSSVMDYVKKMLKSEKDKDRIKWLKTFENCVLPKAVREMIEEALTVVLSKEKFDEWGINEHFEKGLTNSILLYGPPGTGKTMVSESFAAILGMNLMKVDNAALQSNIPGKTEKNIAETFKQAKKENCVVLLDECDSMLYDRNNVGAIMGSEINALLTEIENFDGVCILTTNRLHKLDPALQRRIVAKIELPKPCEKGRAMIWEKLIPGKMPVKKLDFKDLASYPLTGGEIKNAILIGARKAIARNDKCVTMGHLTDAAKFIFQSKMDFEKVQPQMIEENYSEGKTISRSKTKRKVIIK